MTSGAISALTHRAILRDQRDVPVPVAADDRRTWWMFRDRFYWEDDGLEPEEVMALVLERDRRRRRRIDRALDAMTAERSAAGPRRERPSPRWCAGRSSGATAAAAPHAAATSCSSSTT